jgi:8-amino-7-oxononanoate synthase
MPALSPSLSARQQLLHELARELETIERQGLLRRPTLIERIEGASVQIEGRRLVCWCSNDYLGLSLHPDLARAAAEAAAAWGVGARASRLLAGTTRWHELLEDRLAAWFGTETALLFPSGYLANLGVLSALLGPQDIALVDRLSHASLIDAARSSRATLRVFRHNDAGHAERLLSRHSGSGRRMVVTEGVFSMEGDAAPLPALLDAAEAHDALLYVDDAHGAFVLGATGRGAPEAAGILQERLLYMGTLGKALGCQGGFVAGSKVLIEFLRNRARTFIYTTALAVPVAAAAAEALQLLEREPQHRRRLEANVRYFHQRAQAAGLPVPAVPSHIVPIIVGETSGAQRLAEHLWERGHWAPAIRPPTVPEGTARLRLSLTALHTEEHIDQLIAALKEGLTGIGSSEFGVRSSE